MEKNEDKIASEIVEKLEDIFKNYELEPTHLEYLAFVETFKSGFDYAYAKIKEIEENSYGRINTPSKR